MTTGDLLDMKGLLIEWDLGQLHRRALKKSIPKGYFVSSLAVRLCGAESNSLGD